MSRIDEIRARAEKRTPGKWTHKGYGVIVGGPFHEYVRGSSQPQIFSACIDRDVDSVERDANADFVANANEDIPYLLSLLKECEEAFASIACLSWENVETSIADMDESDVRDCASFDMNLARTLLAKLRESGRGSG